MKVFAKENSILGSGRRHDPRHMGLIWPPFRPFFTAVSGNYLRGISSAISYCPFEEGRLLGSWGCSLLPFTVALYPLYVCFIFFTFVLYILYIWNISDASAGRGFSSTAGAWIQYYHSVLHFPLSFSFWSNSSSSFRIQLRRHLICRALIFPSLG